MQDSPLSVISDRKSIQEVLYGMIPNLDSRAIKPFFLVTHHRYINEEKDDEKNMDSRANPFF